MQGQVEACRVDRGRTKAVGHGAKFDEIDKSVSDILPHFEDGPKKPPKKKNGQ